MRENTLHGASRVAVARAHIYVENKAGLTGQTVPGRRIPGHWPYPGPEELAEAEPVGPETRGRSFLLITPPPRARERVTRYPLTVSLSITRSPLVRPSQAAQAD